MTREEAENYIALKSIGSFPSGDFWASDADNLIDNIFDYFERDV